jgi:hypothetical protein
MITWKIIDEVNGAAIGGGDLVGFGKYRGLPECVMLNDQAYCETLGKEPGVRGLLARARAEAKAEALASVTTPEPVRTEAATRGTVDAALDAMEDGGVRFRVTFNEVQNVEILSGKGALIEALHRRRLQGK